MLVPWNPNTRERFRSGTLRIKHLSDYLNAGDQVVAVESDGLIEIRLAENVGSDGQHSA